MTDEELAKLAEQNAATQGEEVITVTGSLVERKELTTPSPISVVDREKLAAAGLTNVGDILQKIPSQGNAINAQVNNAGDGSTRIDLRSLGAQRTLVLMNGRRLVPSGIGADASVDLGTIPLAMVERVEVLKDGASAIYGSDAIAGVVNIITRQDFNGTEATVYTATSNKADGTDYDLSFVTGHSSKTGNVTFSAGYQRQYAVLAGDRGPFANIYKGYDYDIQNDPMMPGYGKQVGAIPSGSSATPGGKLDTQNFGLGTISVPGCTSRFCTWDINQQAWRNFELPSTTASHGGLGDNYNFQPLNYVYTPSQRFNLFSSGHQDLTKNTRIFFEANYQNRVSDQQLAEEPVFAALYLPNGISGNSLYNPFGQDIFNYNRRMTEFGPRQFHQEVDTKRAVVGLDGRLDEDFGPFKDWKWETSFNYGRTDATSSYHGSLILSHLANALGPSMIDPGSGAPICVGTAGDPTTAIPGCVPLDILQPKKNGSNVTQEMKDYLTFTGTAAGFNEQRTSMGTIHGKLADLPNHGDISLALGGDYRHEAGGYEPDPLTATGDTTGNMVAPVHGSFHLFEGFGEVSVVPVSGLKAAQWVELDAAARAYDYNLKNSKGEFLQGGTYKVGGLWRTAGGVSFRGTYGTAFRAPSVGELYSGQSDSFPALEDPCDVSPPSANGMNIDIGAAAKANCSANKPWGGIPAGQLDQNAAMIFNPGTSQQRSRVGGNPHLDPETANIGTVGVVYEPLKGLAFTVDYWNIRINNTLTALLPTTVLNNCYQFGNCTDHNGNPNIIRNANHQISVIQDTVNNIGTTWTSGTDFAVAYTWKNPDFGQFRHSLEGTWLSTYNVDDGTVVPDPKNPSKGVPFIKHYRNYYDNGVLPDLKWNFFTSWVHPSGFGAGFNFRFINSYFECDNNDCNSPSIDPNAVSQTKPYRNTDPRDVLAADGMTVIKNATRSRTVDAYYTGDIFIDYTFKSGGGNTMLSAGINNVANIQPPLVYANTAFNSDESAYDFMGRYFYLRLGQLF